MDSTWGNSWGVSWGNSWGSQTPEPIPVQRGGWIPLYDEEEDKRKRRVRISDAESRRAFIRKLVMGEIATDLKVPVPKREVSDVDLRVAEKVILSAHPNTLRKVEQEYQKWLQQEDDDLICLLLGVFP